MELFHIRFESFKELSYLIIAMPNSHTNKWTHYTSNVNLNVVFTLFGLLLPYTVMSIRDGGLGF